MIIEHMFNWQFIPALIGLGCQAAAIALDNYSRPEIPAFSFFLIFWNITAVQLWRKKQFLFGMQWNTIGSDLATRLRDHTRYQFNGSRIKSPVDGKEILYYPASRRLQYYILSFLLFAICICASLAGAGAIYYYGRPRVSRTLVSPYEQWVVSGGTALQIMLCNYIYYYVALASTDWENHRMEKDFVNSLSGKNLLIFCEFFYFVHSLSYLFVVESLY